MVDQGGELSFLRDITNGWYLHFHKTYDPQIRITGTSGEVDSFEISQAATGDAIVLRSPDL